MPSVPSALIVDPDPTTRRQLGTVHQAAGAVTHAVADGGQALVLLRDMGPPALCVVDMAAPAARPLCLALRARAATHIVLVSAQPLAFRDELSLIDEVFLKPLDVGGYTACVQRLFGAR